MRAMKVLEGLVLVGSVSLAFAADKQVVAQNETIAVKKVKVAHVPAAKNRAAAAKENFENDSRVNGYRLEQESCCGPQ